MSQYETIINNLDAIVFSFNKEGIFTSSNGKGLEKIGLKPGQVVGMSVFEVYQNEPLIVANCKKALNGESTRSTVFAGDVAFDTSFTPIVDSNGALEQVVGISLNVTGYKETEAELNELKQKLEEEKVLMDNLMENIPDTIYFKDKKSRFIRVSASMKNKLGAESMEEMIGKTDFDFHAKEFAEKFYEDEMQIMTTKIPLLNDVVHLRTSSGEKIWEATTKMPLYDDKKNVVGTFGFTKDVTEIKDSEEKLRQSNQELEQFAYISSHDLQEPLRKVKSYSELLEMRYKDQLDEKASKYIDIITSGTERMQALIDDLLTYSRVSTKAKEFEPVYLNEIVDEVCEILEIRINENNAVVDYDKLPIIDGDSRQMKQLFQNLISNAIKFKGENNPFIKISAVDKNNYWLMSIEDNGIGFAMENAERIFMAFQRLHSRAEYSGSGIGLAICKRIIERHEGKIWVQSEIGKGTTFHFTLPKTTTS